MIQDGEVTVAGFGTGAHDAARQCGQAIWIAKIAMIAGNAKIVDSNLTTDYSDAADLQ